MEMQATGNASGWGTTCQGGPAQHEYDWELRIRGTGGSLEKHYYDCSCAAVGWTKYKGNPFPTNHSVKMRRQSINNSHSLQTSLTCKCLSCEFSIETRDFHITRPCDFHNRF
eukprot:1567875-Pleurochrysis_carterae.AAC.1